MKKLGFGVMRMPLLDSTDVTSFDIPQINNMIDTFLKEGFTYFDTAFVYHRGKSEDMIKRCLVERHPRGSFVLATKLPIWHVKDAADPLSLFNKQLTRCGVEFFDYYLLHSLNVDIYQTIKQFDLFGFGFELKKQGKIKNFGFSFHDTPELLEEILADQAASGNPKLDFVQLQINYADWDNPGIQARACYEIARKYDIPIIVMEPVKGGTLANLPPAAEDLLRGFNKNASPASWAVRYAAGVDGVFMVLSGMSNMAQLTDNISYMKDFKPLSTEESAVVDKVVAILKEGTAIGCTYCGYCAKDCPKNIAIPNYFALYNDLKQNPKAFLPGGYYNMIAKKAGKASECIACKVCEKMCPQRLDIIGGLKEVAGEFEK